MYRDGHPDLADLHRFMAAGLSSGEIVPLAYTVADGVTEAIARLLKGDTIGKLVLELDAARRSVPALQAFRCDPHKALVVTGGLGGIGLELCQWLADRGARHLAVVSRSRELTPYQRLRLERLRQRGLDVTVSDVDLSRAELADAFVRELEQRRPVGGVFHVAMALRDVRLVFFGAGATPVRARQAETALASGTVDDAVAALAGELAPPDDVQETGAVKKHLAGVLLRRVAAQLRERPA